MELVQFEYEKFLKPLRYLSNLQKQIFIELTKSVCVEFLKYGHVLDLGGGQMFYIFF